MKNPRELWRFLSWQRGGLLHLQPFCCIVKEGKVWSLPARTAAAVTGWFTRYLPTIHECPVLHVIVVLVSMQLRLQVGSCLTWLWLTLDLAHQHTPCVYSAVCWVIGWILLAFGLAWICVLRLWEEREMPSNSSLSQLYLQNFGLSQPSHTVDSLQVDGAFLMLVSQRNFTPVDRLASVCDSYQNDRSVYSQAGSTYVITGHLL